MAFFVGIEIKHGEDHLSLDSKTGRLCMSKSDPVLTLYKYSEGAGTLRTENGEKCVSPIGDRTLYLTGKFFDYKT